MMLGKRTRPPMKRTTSMTEFTLNPNVDGSQQPLDPLKVVGDQRPPPSPRNNRRSSADFIETTLFLKSCDLCKRRLIPGRDIFMYRGDSAFCSLECRQRQITLDERREKCSLTSKKESSSIIANSVSGNVETVTAAM